MRQIKFRAFNKRKNIFEKIVSSKLLIQLFGDIVILQEDNTFADVSQDFVLMQFTGLQDKNGVEIYESDIVKVLNNNNGYFEVIFVNAYVGGWVLKHKDLHFVSLGARKSEEIEVIGNVFENAELLNN
jgi:uncharacterized phage protein (TIGR01671 family)